MFPHFGAIPAENNLCCLPGSVVHGTSAQALVDATGLGRGSLYAAHTNKDGLFEQALLRYRERTRGHVELI
ncbi:TetR/AcrR family transcriptional regulator [Sandaracinobacter sp. RS1-74]|uniref:TetR/AcrR family transcriptional regulator n=1 Tax=Sandaracinobacteroides sayramensis TaxID=2913411 RepID=UPI001EDA95D2|nr:TetR/AcrR family transcriptional regulator [Sandaracinobacteroides sayramensis]MCG2840617.1 TetR/AcrR family transcriptional regulator [Sandaracinobacteroides sayramensis]